jgi:hypothetical protein
MRYFNPFSSTVSILYQNPPAQPDGVKFWEFLLMYFVLLLSGNPYFVQHYNVIVIFSVVIPLLYFFTNAYRKINFNTVFTFSFLLGYELMHAVVYSLDYSLTIFKLLLVLLLSFASVQMFGDRFVRILISTMCVISIISFVFTALCYVPGLKWQIYDVAMRLFPMNDGFKAYKTPTLLIYTLHPQYYSGEFSYVRNAGIFWESGAFAVFLNLALYLGYITRPIGRMRDLFDRKSIILMIAVVTTTSTMGFLALMLILLFFTLQLRTIVKYIFLPLVVTAAYVAFINVDFLGNKISTQLEESDETNNRFGAAIMDWEDIKERPIIGSSRRLEVIFGNVPMSNAIRRPNGLTNFLRDYGLIYFSVYFMMIYWSFGRVQTYFTGNRRRLPILFGILLLWLLSFSELIFDLPFFKALIFLASAHLAQEQTIDARHHAAELQRS